MKNQRSVLFVAYHYPPARAGVERTTKFLHYLPEFGYRARVLTTAAFGGIREGQVLRAWEPLGAYRWLFNEAVHGGEADSTVRTDPGPLRGAVRWMRRRLLIPDGQVTWLPAALGRGLAALQRWPADVIYSSYPPASAHLVGWGLKWFSGLPWVADFRDAWTYDALDPDLERLPNRRALERRLEAAVVEAADRVVAATELSAAHLRQTYPEAADRIEVIPNGFDPEDFRGLASRRPAAEDPLRLVHTGTFSLSHPSRSPQPLYEALQRLLEADPRWAGRLRLVLAGRLTAAEERAGAALEKAGMLELRGMLPRAEALACQASAHVLVLVDHARQGLATNVPGKFYEYLALQRPVLALCGPGMVAQLMGRLQAGFQQAPDDPAALARLLERIYGQFSRGQLACRIEAAALKPFQRRELARRLAAAFDRLVEAGAARP